MISKTRLSLPFIILASCIVSFFGITIDAFSIAKTSLSITTSTSTSITSTRTSTSTSTSTTTPNKQPQDDYSTIGAAIPTITSLDTGLELASKFWLPTDPNLPRHLLIQSVHHEKRQRWASQLLTQLAKVVVVTSSSSSSSTTTTTTTTTTTDLQVLSSVSHLGRLIQAAAIPTPSTTGFPTTDRLGKEATWIMESLQAIYTLAGRYHHHHNHHHPHLLPMDKDEHCLQGIQTLIQRALVLAPDYPLDQACRVYWAIQGLKARLLLTTTTTTTQEEEDSTMSNHMNILRQRVQALPFEIIPLGIDYESLLDIPQSADDPQNHHHHHQVVCQRLLQEIPFSRDTIVTRQGTAVTERRGTAWVAAPGVGALAYSGKLMIPQPIPPLLESMMRKVEQRLGLADAFFDCALCNHYADATAACKFHTDPEHGTMWDRTTVVVAAGSDRIFAFKPITTIWNDWDVAPGLAFSSSTEGGSTATTTPLFAGDLVVMRENCNDDFYHAVHAGISDDPRVSVVLKRAIGPRGHGLPGQGRRYKHRNPLGVGPPSSAVHSKQKSTTVPPSKPKRKKQ